MKRFFQLVICTLNDIFKNINMSLTEMFAVLNSIIQKRSKKILYVRFNFSKKFNLLEFYLHETKFSPIFTILNIIGKCLLFLRSALRFICMPLFPQLYTKKWATAICVFVFCCKNYRSCFLISKHLQL